MVSVIIQLLTAIFKAFPTIESLIENALECRREAKVTEALNRKQAKDKAVDEAIDGVSKSDNS